MTPRCAAQPPHDGLCNAWTHRYHDDLVQIGGRAVDPPAMAAAVQQHNRRHARV